MLDLSNVGIILQIIGILLVFPLKLMMLYYYIIKATQIEVTTRNDEIIKNRADDYYLDWVMLKVQFKINILYFNKIFKHLTKNFQKDLTDSFHPSPFHVVTGGTVVIVGLLFTLK